MSPRSVLIIHHNMYICNYTSFFTDGIMYVVHSSYIFFNIRIYTGLINHFAQPTPTLYIIQMDASLQRYRAF